VGRDELRDVKPNVGVTQSKRATDCGICASGDALVRRQIMLCTPWKTVQTWILIRQLSPRN
jgi:hypothetical protein